LFKMDLMLPTEIYRLDQALFAEPRLEAAWLIVNSRMDNTAVMAGLVVSQCVFFFEQHDLLPGIALL